jgi:SAM-dependent methyltransferase
LTEDRKGTAAPNTKREFREEFHRGNLFRLWHGEDGKGEYLARWAKHRCDVVVGILDRHRLGREGWSLDVGLGSGLLLADLGRRGGRAVGADFSRSILEEVRGRQAGAGVSLSSRLFQADVENLPFRDGAFELVTCLGVLEYLEKDGTAMAEFHRILRPGGSMILAVASYHRIGSLASLAIQKFAKRRKGPDSALHRTKSSLEDRVRMVHPVRLRDEAVRAGFNVRIFKCFGGKILGRYLPVRLFIPGVIYIGDHCVLLLRKPG